MPRLTPHLLRRLVVDVGLAGLDQVFGPVIEPIEIVRRMKEVLAPVEAEPAHVALDGVDIFLLLLGRIGVVEAQVAAPAELLGDAEVEADRLGMADMQVAVRLRRKAGDHRGVPLGVEIGLDDVADEIAPASPPQPVSAIAIAAQPSSAQRPMCQIRVQRQAATGRYPVPSHSRLC